MPYLRIVSVSCHVYRLHRSTLSTFVQKKSDDFDHGDYDQGDYEVNSDARDSGYVSPVKDQTDQCGMW